MRKRRLRREKTGLGGKEKVSTVVACSIDEGDDFDTSIVSSQPTDIAN